MARTRNDEKDLNEILSDMENIDEPDTVDVPLFQEAKFETPFVSAPVEQPKQNYASKLTPADEEMIVIGSSTTISSDINCSGNVEIRGQLQGNLIVSGVVTVSGSVEGNVEASEVTLLNDNNEDVDPVGACVGMNGSRVNAIVDELGNEKIDIINWSENPAMLIENALSPAKVISVIADSEEKTAKVVVPDYQLSLAIGKEGQNARLAARLTGFKIDIKSETQARESGDFMDYENDYDDYDEYDDEEYYDENGEYYEESDMDSAEDGE